MPLIEAHRIIFPAKLRACLERYAFEASAEHDNEIVIETAFSVVSSGTELVAFTNDHDMGTMPFSINPSNPYPVFPGYATIGTIIDLGDGVKGYDIGDMVFVAKGRMRLNECNQRTSRTTCWGCRPFIRLSQIL